MLVLALCVLVLGCSLPVAAAPSPSLPWNLPPDPNDVWQLTTEESRRYQEIVWSQVKKRVSFCLGDEFSKVSALLRQSFPSPLPMDQSDPDVCGNSTSVIQNLCQPEEILLYYQYILRTDNIEKIPSNFHCQTGQSSGACTPGFFQVNFTSGPRPYPCCPGYFCPVMLTCMIPCPLGAYCPRAQPADPPATYLDYNLEGLILNQTDKWCAPYGYKHRPDLGCGGADKWGILPAGAFPAMPWHNGSGNIYCDGGSYCPNTTTKLQCTRGHMCRQGSTQMAHCPLLSSCPPGTTTSNDNYVGVTVTALLFLVLGAFWHLSRFVNNNVLRFLTKKERLRVTWNHMQPQITVITVAEDKGWLPYFNRFDSRRRASTSAGSGGDDLGQPLLTVSHEAAETSEAPSTALSGLRGLLTWRGPGRLGSFQRADTAMVNTPAHGPVWAPFEMTVEDQPQESLPSRDTGPVLSVGSTVNLPSTQPCVVHRAAQQRRTIVEITFHNLALTLRTCGKRVLNSVSGALKAQRLTAIMGPSGAGKTTLMATLAGKACYGRTSGTIKVNGVPDRLERFRPVMGFVPQDDVMHRTLTVEENLLFAARLRLPVHFTHGDHLYYVEQAIQVLGLADIRHQIIGDEENRGISGGQRKRVNVGLELVADPVILFLDEPTSGLDSTASRLVMDAVHRVAHMGVTAAAVIHQPSYEIFAMFDDVILLGRGGNTVYYGPQSDIKAYFQWLGYDIPQHTNPADVFLDIVSGTIRPTGSEQPRPRRRVGSTAPAMSSPFALAFPSPSTIDLAKLWREHERRQDSMSAEDASEAWRASGGDDHAGPSDDSREQQPGMLGSIRRAASYCAQAAGLSMLFMAEYCRTALARVRAGLVPRNWRNSCRQWWQEDGEGAPQEPLRVTAGFFRQFVWLLGRTALRRSREPLVVFTDYAVFALTGSLLGLMSDRGRGTILKFASDQSFNVVAMGLMSSVAGLKTFGRDRTVFYREAASGLNRLAYFCANEAFDNLGTLVRSVLYMVMYISFAQPRAVWWQMWVVTVAIIYCCTGLSYLLSVVLQPATSQLTAAIIALLNGLVSHQRNPTGLLRAAYNVCYARYGLEGMVIAESNRLTGVWLLARCADLEVLQYDITHFWFCIQVLVMIGMVFRACAALSLYIVNRDKQQ